MLVTRGPKLTPLRMVQQSSRAAQWSRFRQGRAGQGKAGQGSERQGGMTRF